MRKQNNRARNKQTDSSYDYSQYPSESDPLSSGPEKQKSETTLPRKRRNNEVYQTTIHPTTNPKKHKTQLLDKTPIQESILIIKECLSTQSEIIHELLTRLQSILVPFGTEKSVEEMIDPTSRASPLNEELLEIKQFLDNNTLVLLKIKDHLEL